MKKISFLVLFLALASSAFAGNKNDLAYLGYDELDAVAGLTTADEIAVFEDSIPKQGTTIAELFTLLGSTGLTLDDTSGASPSLTFTDGTDETAVFSKVDSSFLGLTTLAADGFNVLVGNVKIGNGTPGVSLTGEDLYVEGTSEFDGAAQFDGAVSATSTLGVTGALTASSHLTADGRIDIGTVETFTDSDATPDVSTGSYFKTNTSTVTITDFDGTGISDGQIITVISKGAITFDVTTSGIVGGTTDIITAAGDITKFMYDGTDWYVVSRMDLSDDLN